MKRSPLPLHGSGPEGGRGGREGGREEWNGWSEEQMIALHSLQVVATAQPPCIGSEYKPNDYLIFSILTTIFCCWLIGVIAIIYSVRVSTARFRYRVETFPHYKRLLALCTKRLHTLMRIFLSLFIKTESAFHSKTNHKT